MLQNKPVKNTLLPQVSKLDRIFHRELSKQQQLLSYRKAPQITMQQVINVYNNNYQSELDHKLSFMANSPRLKLVKRNMVLAMMPSQSQKKSNSVFIKDRFFVCKDTRKTGRGSLGIDITKIEPGKEVGGKNRRKELRRNFNLLINKGTYKKERYGSDASISARSQEALYKESTDKSLDKLKVKLLELESINNVSTIQSCLPENRKVHNSYSNGSIQRYVPETEQQPKSKRYVDSTMDQINNEEQLLEDDELSGYFFKINTKVLSNRPQLPAVSTAVRQYKSKLPLMSKKYRDRDEVTGWAHEDSINLFIK